MIKTQDLCKNFGQIEALKKLNSKIDSGSIFGLIGSNGAGKSTLLRLMAGIYKPSSGSLTYHGQEVFLHPELKHKIILVPDQPAFLPGENLLGMAQFYGETYKNWSTDYFRRVHQVFNLDLERPLESMSKGMQRQASLLLSLAAKPELLLMDEAFDGLDPVMRENLKKILADEVAAGTLTCIIASHNLRELEGFCDQIGLIHEGRLIYERDLQSMDLGVYKVQTAFKVIPAIESLEDLGLTVLHYDKRGSILNLVVRNEEAQIYEQLEYLQPMILDLLPLTLEELFIYELEDKGYAVRNLLPQ